MTVETDLILAEVWLKGGAQNVAFDPSVLPKSAVVHGKLITPLIFSTETSFSSCTVEKKIIFKRKKWCFLLR